MAAMKTTHGDVRCKIGKYHHGEAQGKKDRIEENSFAWTSYRPDETRLQLGMLPVTLLEASDEVDGEIDRHAQRKSRKDSHRHVKILPCQSDNGIDYRYGK